MHEVNHPSTKHLTADIWSVDPREACGGRPVGLLWASPDCKHFSKAKGGKPVEKKHPRPRLGGGALGQHGRAPRHHPGERRGVPDLGTARRRRPAVPGAEGPTFKRWTGELERLGYVVEWRELRACDYGAPTIRKRLFLIARSDGEPIVWPQPSHGDPKSDAVKSGR
jgi:DNA (cytosine-5)-methyltransferase 1